MGPADAAPSHHSFAGAAFAQPGAGAKGDVIFTGHGLGPGVGMGQWGAFGYAALDHWTYQQLLAHYYSDATEPVSSETLSAAADAQTIHVVIEENDGYPVTVTSPSKFTILNHLGEAVLTAPGGTATREVDTARGLWDLETASSCGARTWKVVVTGLRDPTAVPASSQADAPRGDLLTLCRGDGVDVTFRGRIEAYDYCNGSDPCSNLERTINEVALEQYVADVTTSESPAGWAAYGGTDKSPQSEPWGFQELEAQAVAVRSYVLAAIAEGGWYGYADICDDVCQTYSHGVGYETSVSLLAAKDTTGQYLAQRGAPAPTEYGSSSGGHTETLSYTGGPVIFEGVPDAGDAVCIDGPGTLGCNPEHNWTVAVPVSLIDSTYPSIGTLEKVTVTARDASSRVLDLTFYGSRSDVAVAVAAFVGAFAGFVSTLFSVTGEPGATATVSAQATSAGSLGLPGSQRPVGLPEPR